MISQFRIAALVFLPLVGGTWPAIAPAQSVTTRQLSATPAVAARTREATTRPVERGGTTPAAASNPLPEFRSVGDLCRLREAQLIRQNTTILTQSAAASAEKDPEKRRQILQGVLQSKRALDEVELSWQRMDCATVQRPGGTAFGGR